MGMGIVDQNLEHTATTNEGNYDRVFDMRKDGHLRSMPMGFKCRNGGGMNNHPAQDAVHE